MATIDNQTTAQPMTTPIHVAFGYEYVADSIKESVLTMGVLRGVPSTTEHPRKGETTLNIPLGDVLIERFAPNIDGGYASHEFEACNVHPCEIRHGDGRIVHHGVYTRRFFYRVAVESEDGLIVFESNPKDNHKNRIKGLVRLLNRLWGDE